MGGVEHEVVELLGRLPHRQVDDEQRVVVGPHVARRLAALVDQPPHEPRRRLGERVDPVERVDELGRVGVVEGLAQAGHVELGEVPPGATSSSPNLRRVAERRRGRHEQRGDLVEAGVGQPHRRALDGDAGPRPAVGVEQRRGHRAHADVALAVVERPAPPAGDQRGRRAARRATSAWRR